jgi:NIPSNAP
LFDDNRSILVDQVGILRAFVLDRHCERSEAIHGTHVKGWIASSLSLLAMTAAKEVRMSVTVFIRYQLDPFKRSEFEEYARRWLAIIPKCGGDLVGYFMPHEGTNNIAFALISFKNLAAYENYRERLRTDEEAMANFGFAEENRFILAEERTFLRKMAA